MAEGKGGGGREIQVETRDGNSRRHVNRMPPRGTKFRELRDPCLLFYPPPVQRKGHVAATNVLLLHGEQTPANDK